MFDGNYGSWHLSVEQKKNLTEKQKNRKQLNMAVEIRKP
jgi:hypothetical protein